jgi:hypothetical protein
MRAEARLTCLGGPSAVRQLMLAGAMWGRFGVEAQVFAGAALHGARSVISQPQAMLWKTDESAFQGLSILQCSNVRDRYPYTHVARLTLKAFALERYLPPIVALLSNGHHAPQRGGRFRMPRNFYDMAEAAGSQNCGGALLSTTSYSVVWDRLKSRWRNALLWQELRCA